MARVTRTAPRTAPAAPIPRRWPHAWLMGPAPGGRASGAPVAAEAVANGLREIGSGAGPVDALGIIKP